MSGGDLFAPSEPAPASPAKPRFFGWKICAVCGVKPAAFGFGASVLRRQVGRWACLPHREAVERMAA